MRLMLDLSKNNLIKATKDKSKLILITKQIIRNGVIVTNKYWVTPEQAKEMLANTPFYVDKFWKLAQENKRDEALQYAKEHGIKWDEMSHKQQNWLKAVKAVSNFAEGKTSDTKEEDITTKQANPSPSSNLSTANSSNNLQELQNALDNRRNDWDTLLKLAKNNGITWTESDNNDINKMRVSMAVSKFLKNNGGSSKPSPQNKSKSLGIKKTKVAETPGKAIKEPPKSERDKRIEKALSKMTKEEAHICKVTGIVGEDKESIAYIVKYLFPKFESSAEELEKEINLQKEEERKRLSKTKLKGFVNKHIRNEVNYWFKGIKDYLLSVPLEDEEEYEIELKELERLDTQDKQRGISTVQDSYQNRVEKFKALKKRQSNYMIQYAFRDAILGLPVEESKYYKEHIKQHHRWVYGVPTRGQATEYGNVPSPYTETQQKDPKMADPFLFESLNFLQGYNEFRDTAKEMYDSYLGLYTILKKEFDDSPKDEDENMTNYTNKLRHYIGSQLGAIVLDLEDTSRSTEFQKYRDNLLRLINTKKGRDVLFNLSYFRYAQMAVLSANWKNTFWGWEYVEPIKMDLSELHKLNLQGSLYKGYSPSSKLTKDNVEEMKDRLSIEIASMKPSLNSSGKKTAQEIKNKLHEKYDEALEVLEAYNLNSGDLMKEGNINCILSYAPKNEATDMIRKINNDWDSQEHSTFKPKVRGVYKVEGLPVEDDFNKLKSKAGKSTTLYHGTGTLATVSIVGKSGEFKIVRPKVGRMLGDGIYLADKSSKSAQYISDRGFTRGAGNNGSLIICDAVLGKKSNKKDNNNADTIEAIIGDSTYKNLRNNEWCVKNPKAVIPRYLVHTELISSY